MKGGKKMTIEEIEIIVKAEVDKASKNIKKIAGEIKKNLKM